MEEAIVLAILGRAPRRRKREVQKGRRNGGSRKQVGGPEIAEVLRKKFCITMGHLTETRDWNWGWRRRKKIGRGIQLERGVWQ